ncbi:MAG: hypothetical protein ABEI77_03605 [Halorientalis sp.]
MSDDPEDDPFADLDAPEDVDPFEDLEGPPESDEPEDEKPDPTNSDEQPPADDGTETEAASGSAGVNDPGEVPFGGGDAGTEGMGSNDKNEGPTDDPFASFSTTTRQSAQGDDPFSAFESAGVDEIDPDVVWESLTAAQEEGMPEFDEKTYYEVSKHKFCERCEYFSSPPECTCTFEGAAIVEFLDMETVRLLNCPVVAEQRQLEESVGKIGND